MLKNISSGHFSARSPYVNNELRPARCMLSSHVATADSCPQGITLVTGSRQIILARLRDRLVLCPNVQIWSARSRSAKERSWEAFYGSIMFMP